MVGEIETYTREQIDAYKRAEAYASPVAELEKRYPDTEWELVIEWGLDRKPKRKFVIGRWSRDEDECGLQHEVPLATMGGDVVDLEARARIARYAIFLVECRNGKA